MTGNRIDKNGLPVTLITKIADIEISSIMDVGFSGAFEMTPELHSHAYYELHAALKGEYCLDFLESDAITMLPYTICMIPSNIYHSSLAKTSDAEKLAIRFTYKSTKNYSDCLPLFRHCNELLSQNHIPIEIKSHRLCELLSSIRVEIMQGEYASDIIVQALLQQFYAYLFRLLTTQIGTANDVKLNNDDQNERYYRIDKFFFDNYSQPIVEDDLANELKLSKRQTSRVLHLLFGMSFREKLIETRMQKAAKLLTRTDIPIEQIAYMVGYTSVSGFHVTFQKRFGVTGNTYRKQARKRGD